MSPSTKSLPTSSSRPRPWVGIWRRLSTPKNSSSSMPRLTSAVAAILKKKIDVQRVVADLNAYITRMGATRLVIDPVGPLLFNRDATSRAPDQARMLFYALQANGNTTNLLTTYSVERNVRGLEEYLVAGTIVLDMELFNSRFVRTLTVEKMRSTALEPGQYLFKIVPDRGIVLQGSSEAVR